MNEQEGFSRFDDGIIRQRMRKILDETGSSGEYGTGDWVQGEDHERLRMRAIQELRYLAEDQSKRIKITLGIPTLAGAILFGLAAHRNVELAIIVGAIVGLLNGLVILGFREASHSHLDDL